MKERHNIFLLLISLLFFGLISLWVTDNTYGGTKGLVIRVGITKPAPWNLKFAEAVGVYYRNSSGEWLLLKEPIKPGRLWFISQEESRLVLTTEMGDKIISDYPLRFIPRSATDLLNLNGSAFPGELEFWPKFEGLTGLNFDQYVFNNVELEDYVCGVLAGESYAGWKREAQAAQAVAIRSYTLYNLGRHQQYDFCDQVHCQKYVGVSNNPSFTEAVKRTEGEVLTWNGKVINAVYHSSSGGHTKNNEDVWGGTPLPYLRGVMDFDQRGENYYWKKSHLIRVDELSSKLNLNDYEELKMTPFYNETEVLLGFYFQRSENGEAKIYSNEALRRIFGFQSPNFQVFHIKKQSLEEALKGAEILSLGYGIEEDGCVSLRATTDLRLPRVQILNAHTLYQDEYLLFVGKGSGHGVGLSQWGAQAMAEQGHKYQAILKHYYGARVRSNLELTRNYKGLIKGLR